jgi:hypothetical protein
MVRIIAQVALEAAERVRPRRDPTNAMRSRQYRAKKRAERRVVTRNVADDDTSNVAAERNVTRNVAGPSLASNLLLLDRLTDAAGGNVHSGAHDTAPGSYHDGQRTDRARRH